MAVQIAIESYKKFIKDTQRVKELYPNQQQQTTSFY
jgi:hypothetical protein